MNKHNFRRFVSYLFTVSAITLIELKVNGGVSTNGYMALIAISAAYFGTVAWDKVTKKKNGGDNG